MNNPVYNITMGVITLQKRIKELEAENKELKKENEQLKDMLSAAQSQADEFYNK